MYTYYRQTYQSSSINKKTADVITSKNLEEKIILESDNVAQNENQINENEDNIALFDAPQKKNISKPIKPDNCSKVEEKAKPEDESTVESNNIEQNANQIIENSPTMDLNECVGDVSFIILFYYL